MNINYDHSKNLHTLLGPALALPVLFNKRVPKSLLDVGCGVGTWLKAACQFGVVDVQGIDGVAIPRENLLFPPELFRQMDLAQPIDLRRRYDAALCLEVGEHLAPEDATVLIRTLTHHADTIIFSAACPWQLGQNHINCQWPSYWQALFNENQYSCSDDVRWMMWDDERIEPWYRQNIFVATKNQKEAGKEKRIRSVVHPAIFALAMQESGTLLFPKHVQQIEQGRMHLGWYLQAFGSAVLSKMRRRKQ